MDPKTPLRLLLLTSLLAAAAGQDWTDDQLIEHGKGFQTELLAARLQTIGELLPDRAALFSALVARVHGDHREYLLKVDRLLDELADERWQTREAAERTLIEIGSRARTLIEQRRQQPRVLEQGFRCARILEALNQKSPDQEARELKLMRGLVATALYLDPDPRLLRALRSALGHTDASVVEAAIRALGKHGGDTEAEAIEQQMAWKGGAYRLPCAAALGRMRGDKAIAP
ncbi:MAG: hypothetical protein FJ265_19930, partial [Planctomycetes bacterium]|nr:hypothetical protein [Planctomycetota bacterium]